MTNASSEPGSTGTAGAIKESEGAFTRKASGLVRAFSPFDALMYNVIAINPFVTAALTYTLMVAAFPGANPGLAILIVGAFCCAEALVYALLIAVMPRSGGDYVFQSRILNGGIGSFFVFAGIILAQLVSLLILGTIGGGIIMAPFLTVLGGLYHSPGLISAGIWFGGKYGVVVVAAAVTVFGVGLNVFGLKLYARVQRYIFWPALLCLLLVFAMLLTSDTHTFRDNFDSFMASKFHVRNAYATIISRSSVSSAFSLKATVLALPIAAYGLIFPAWSAFQAGEVRQANSTRKNIFALVGAEVVAAGLAACAAFLLIHLVGSHFFAASADLNFNNPTKYPLPVPPYFSLFATFAAGPAFMTFLLFATGILWFWMIAPNVPLGVSRAMMAMSLDRVLPEAFGRVSSRSHTPVFSLLFSGVIALAACGLYLASPSVLAFTASFIMLSLITFVVTMVAGILLPIRRKDLYNAAPAAVRTRFLSVPVIVSAAVVFIAFSCFVFFESLTRGAYGVNTTKGLVAIAVYYAVSLVVYVSAKVYRKRVDHFDLTLVYKQLPVE